MNTLPGGTPHCNLNTSGSYGSYEWQLWSNQSTGCLTTYPDAEAAFSAEWENSGDFIARVGLRFDGTKTHQELGVFSADFTEQRTGDAGDFSYIGVYGWMVTPNIEFYIVEDTFSPPIKLGPAKLNTIQADGGAYDVYSIQRVTTGMGPITTLYSIRQTSRHCGQISISAHFSQWANLGVALGKIEEVSLFVESGGGRGSIDFTTALIQLK